MKLGGNWKDDHHGGVAAVALPSVHHPLSYNTEAHATLVYAGDDKFNADVTGLRTTVQYLARTAAPFVAEIIGTEMFGENGDEPVLLVDHPQFKAMRRQLEHHNASQWPFRPHVAIPTLDGIHRLPKDVLFDRLGLWVGDEREHYWLGNGNPTKV